MISIIDVPGSNSTNLKYALEHIGEVELVRFPEDISPKSSVLFLPGVGFFHAYISFLEEHSWVEFLYSTNMLVVGICVGYQVMCVSSDESSSDKGLGFFNAVAEKIKPSRENVKVPHVGRKALDQVDFLPPLSAAYFVHSYAVKFLDEMTEEFYQLFMIGDEEYVCAIKKGNKIGLQYHPELSGDASIEFFRELVLGDING